MTAVRGRQAGYRILAAVGPRRGSRLIEAPMKSVQAHYCEHLGPVYDWSLGDFEQASARAEAQLLAAGLGPGGGALAVDLGCGSGRQSVPLLRLGYRVLAIDTCSVLLQALKARARGLPLRAIEEDLRGFRRHLAEPAAA